MTERITRASVAVHVYLTSFSVPLILGVLTALWFANTDMHAYESLVDGTLIAGISLHFLVNDVFMPLFFGLATKEIVESFLPGGDLYSEEGGKLAGLRKAMNPLFGTMGGVLGPIGTYLVLAFVFYRNDPEYAAVLRGWGIPTATDIALAWLVARVVFGVHAAVKYLLLLAVVDDGLGLGIIAVFYPDPHHPTQPLYLLLTLLAMGVAWYFRKKAGVVDWRLYIAVPGVISWIGLFLAGLHPALALVFVVPFMPNHHHDAGLFVDEDEIPETEEHPHATIDHFGHKVKPVVDYGLFFFGLANAGVPFAQVSELTLIVLLSLVLGKTVGITLFSWAAMKLGFPLPEGMTLRHLVVTGLIAGMGLTVALFVAGQAFPAGSALQGSAKMGAVFSAAVFVLALGLARMLGIKRVAAS